MIAKTKNDYNKGLKYSWRRTNDFDPYTRLAAATVRKAAEDYAKIAAGLESPYINRKKARKAEVEANTIEHWLMDPRNPFTSYLGLNLEVIEQFILKASSGDYVSDIYDGDEDDD
tara:strand:+ start:344 stop:688 length:345 start_codon:yes stop_codon:yes gene_type:complete